MESILPLYFFGDGVRYVVSRSVGLAGPEEHKESEDCMATQDSPPKYKDHWLIKVIGKIHTWNCRCSICSKSLTDSSLHMATHDASQG